MAYGVVNASEPAGSAFLYRLGPVNMHFMRPTTQSVLVFEDAIVVAKLGWRTVLREARAPTPIWFLPLRWAWRHLTVTTTEVVTAGPRR